MCLTPEALALFLNLIGHSMVTSTPEHITVHATQGDVVWIAVGEQWCTTGPVDDRRARFETDE